MELENSDVAKDALGEHVYGMFIEAKHNEWDSFRTYVSQWEIDKYLERY